MFSAIIGLFEKLQELKLKKQKKGTKKEVKKAEKKLKEEGSSLVGVKDKAKKSKKVKDSKEKEKKLQIKVWILKIIKWVVEIIEQLIMWFISIIGIYGFFIILVVIVLMIAIYGLLHIDLEFLEGRSTKKGILDCIDGPTAMMSTEFDMSQISQLIGTFKDGDKKAAEALSFYSDIVNRDFTTIIENPTAVNDVKSKVGNDNLIYFLYGMNAVENVGGIKNIPINGDSILEYPSTQVESGGYAFLGLHYNNVFDGNYKFNGVNGTKYLKDDFVNSIKSKYQPKEPPIYENNFFPYGASTQIGIITQESMNYYYDKVNAELPAIMDSYGITANRDKLTGFIHMFVAAAKYHSGGTETLTDENRPKLLSLWCALWASTSENDSERGFDKIDVFYSNFDYTEPQMRSYIFGSNNMYMTWDESKSNYFKINGKVVDKVLWSWVRENCGNTDYFDTTAKVWIDNMQGGTYDSPMFDSSYAVASYLVGRELVSSLGTVAPMASGGNKEYCECVEEGGTSNIPNRDFSNVKAGEIQGSYPEDIKQNMMSSQFAQHFGKLVSVSEPNKQLKNLGKTREEWRLGSKWKVPYQYQSASTESWSAGVNFDGVTMSNNCPLMMQAYMFSAMTGRAINVAEITALGNAYEAVRGATADSRQWNGIAMAAGDQGFYVRFAEYHPNTKAISDGSYTEGAKENAKILFPESNGHSDVISMINYVLDNNGLVGVNVRGNSDTNSSGDCSGRPTSPSFAHSNHYFCITERKGDRYYTHTAAYPNNDEKENGFTIDEIIGSEGKALCTCWQFNLMFAWNPSLQSNSGSNPGVNGTALSTVEVPDSVAQTGIISDYTDYNQFFPKWTDGTNQRKVADLWSTKGKAGDSGVATIDGLYVVAVRAKFGAAGDAISITFDDNTTLNCIIGDIKGSDASDWGHVYSGKYSLIEWESVASSQDELTAGLKGKGIYGKKIRSISNYGSYLENEGILSPSSGGGNSGSSLPDYCKGGGLIAGEFVETPGKFQGPWGDITEYVNKLTGAKEKSKNLLAHVGKKPRNEGESNYEYKVDKWKAVNGKGVVRYSQSSRNNKGEEWMSLSSGDSTLAASACGAYSTACILSTMTGKYINVPEVALAVNTYNLRHPDGKKLATSNSNGDGAGAFTHTDLAAVIEECGFKTECLGSVNIDKLDACLNSGGMALYVVSASKGVGSRYTGGSHYVVIREKVEGGYLIYSSTNWSGLIDDRNCNIVNTATEVVGMQGSNGAQMVLVTP